METPILLIIFRRPDTTAAVLEAVRRVKPSKLYVAADGPVLGDIAMEVACKATRTLVANSVDWDCELYWRCAPINLGCRRGVYEAIDWFFANEKEGIILEDDVVPHPTFFDYCSELLEHYRDDGRIGAITGLNLLPGRARSCSSYFFSVYNHCWGWASWRRAWCHYDVDLFHWPDFRDEGWLEDVGGKRFAAYFCQQLERVRTGKCDTWDYIWSYSLWRQGMVTCVPSANLVRNLGIGHSAATHTSLRPSRLDGRTLGPGHCSPMAFPLIHPGQVIADRSWDRAMFRRHHNPYLLMRIAARLRRLILPV